MLRLLPILAVLWLLLTGAASGKALHTAEPPPGNFLLNLSEASSPDALTTREGIRESDPFGYECMPGDAYCHNDPVNKVDVLGLKEQVIDGSAPAFFSVPGNDDHVYVGFPLEEDGWFSPLKPNGGYSIVPSMIPKSRFLKSNGYYSTTAATDRLRGIASSQLELDYWLDARFYVENGSHLVGGFGEMAAGVVAAPESAGVSLVATVHGYDVASTAWARLGAGRGSNIQSGTSQLLQFVPGVSRQTAETIDIGISFASIGGSMWAVGRGPLLLTPRFAPVLEGEMMQPGLSSLALPRTPGLGAVSTTDELLLSGSIPGKQGVVLNQRTVRFSDLWELSNASGAEFILTREGGSFMLRSGSLTRAPIAPGVRPIVHTHPLSPTGYNSVLPSITDINVLNNLWSLSPNGVRPVSQIITGPGTTTVFRATGLDRIPVPIQ